MTIILSYSLFCAILFLLSYVKSINIALHAQVNPNVNGRVVGSVITTQGMQKALLKHDDVDNCEVFYPFHLVGFTNHTWDLVIIEGWFPTIHDFIRLARIDNPNVIVIFFCLDPKYPSIDQIMTFDIDGYFTNSERMVNILSPIAPTRYIPLAADPEIMRPNNNDNQNSVGGRNITVVYVGAGGGMVTDKKHLLLLLEAALPYGLVIYGSHWNEVPSVKSAWRGVLPQDQLAQAYSSAHVVIASTIDTQTEYGTLLHAYVYCNCIC